MPLVPAEAPAPTPELEALTPAAGESPMDALARVGDGIVSEFGGDDKRDSSRKDKKLPRQLAALIALRAQGFDNAEIAEKLGCTRQKLAALITKARKEYGWSDLADQIAHRAVPQAVENVVKHLDYEGSVMAQVKGQSLMTREVLKGVGVFKTHSAVKQESKNETTNVLRVEIVMPELPPGVQALSLTEGSVFATPRRALPSAEAIPGASIVEGEVVGAGK